MIFDLIKKRRSVFPVQYNQESISKEAIEKILEAANWAPTHRKTEPWRFKVVQGDKLEELGTFVAEKYKGTTDKYSDFKYKKIKQKFLQSNCVISICMQRDVQERIPEWEEIASTAMAVQNMWLMATDLNIGSYWSSPALIQYADKFFNLAEGEKCLGFFYMGYFDEELPEGKREPIENKVEWL
ncbi:nitroreductase family protein [Mesonia aquimarina]|uniref:nitroreductase family protein n=1 Tax=Mesonia aquimarina TaxID=1504967 RepID=UPI000EF60148|nr:nitroreductase [Mesonia aquimarina]